MNRNRRADDLGALMLPSGSTGFSKALDCAEPRRFLDLVDRHRIFLGFAPNFFLALLYDRICRSTPKQEAQPAPTWGLSGLRCVFSGGEPTVRQLLLRLVHHVRQRLPRCPRQLYITGRFNNTLLLNGETIFPVEVECSLEQVRIPDLTSSFTLVFAHLAPDAHLRPTAQLRSGRCPSHTIISKEPRSVRSPDPTSGVLDPEREVHETSIQAHRQVTAQLPPRPPSIPYSPSRLRAPRRQSGRRQLSPAPEIAKRLESAGEEVRFLGALDGPPDIADLVSRLTWNEGLMMVGYSYELIDEPRCVALMSDLIAMTTWKGPYDDDYKEEE
ncbi:hypothetical protein AnigIFM63309_003107 [Aspergillus niger]|nr:hypothetical protein AnigIFM63309_003107 [Aspergillus niger]